MNPIKIKKKMGFPVPLDNWFNQGMKKQALELLVDNNSRINDFINRKELIKFLSNDQISSDYDYNGKKIWMLMNLEQWMRKYF